MPSPVQEEWSRRQVQQRGFPLHKYVHHGLRSRAMFFNFVGPLIVAGHLGPLRQALAEQGVT